MKTQMYADGKRRVTLKIEYRATLDNLVSQFVTDIGLEDHDYIINEAKTLSKGSIMDNVRRAILVDGIDRAEYFIGDNDLGDVCDEVRDIFAERFPEFGE